MDPFRVLGVFYVAFDEATRSSFSFNSILKISTFSLCPPTSPRSSVHPSKAMRCKAKELTSFHPCVSIQIPTTVSCSYSGATTRVWTGTSATSGSSTQVRLTVYGTCQMAPRRSDSPPPTINERSITPHVFVMFFAFALRFRQYRRNF